MNWNRTKTILIFLFLAINIFLYNVLGKLDAEIESIDAGVIVNATKVARQQNVEISPEAVTGRRYKNGQMELFGLTSEPESTAGRILGKNYTVTESRSDKRYFSFEKNGSSLVIDNHKLHYVSDKAYAEIKNEEEAAERAIASLSEFDIKKKNVKVVKKGTENNKSYLIVKPSFNGYDIEGVYLKLFYDNDGVTEFVGEWFDFVSFSGGKDYLDDITSVIVGLKNTGEEKTEILNSSFSYYVPVDALGGMYVSAIPVYVFEKSDGELIIIDARTGKNVKGNR